MTEVLREELSWFSIERDEPGGGPKQGIGFNLERLPKCSCDATCARRRRNLSSACESLVPATKNNCGFPPL